MYNSDENKGDNNSSIMVAMLPILVMNQHYTIQPLEQMVSKAVEENNSKKAKEVLELILKIQVNPRRSLIDMAMLGVVPNDINYQELEFGIRFYVAMQHQMFLPPLIKKIFDAGLITVNELAELTKSETGIEMVSHIKHLALGIKPERKTDEVQEVVSEEELKEEESIEAQRVAYSELALVLAIKQKDWNYVINSDLLIEGQLADHEEVLADIYDANRFDILALCKEYNVFGIDEDFYADIDSQDENGETLLMQAAVSGDIKEVKRLLALGANPAIKDSNGNNTLIHAVTYATEDLVLINVADFKRTHEIKRLMEAKSEIVKVLVKDKRVNINERNFAGLNPFDVVISQGLVTTENGLTELRGDHQMMDALLNCGANPIFGEFEWSFKAKTMMTLFLSVALTGLKNHLVNATGIGIILRVVLSPLIEVLNIACDAVVAYKAYNDVKNPIYRYIRTCLDSEYANDAFFSLDKKPLIGAFHINWMGKVYSGDKLKEFMANHVGYQNILGAYFTAESLPEHMNAQQKLELKNEIAHRFRIVKTKLNGFLMPWTRESLITTAIDLETAYKVSHSGVELPEEVMKIINQISLPENHERVIIEILEDANNLSQFFQIYSAVESGALVTSLETRFNLESLALKFQNKELIAKSFAQRVVEYSKTQKHEKEYTFADLKVACDIMTKETVNIEGFTFPMLLQTMQNIADKHLEKNVDLRGLTEKFKDVIAASFRYVLYKGVEFSAKALDVEKSDIYHYTSKLLAGGCASINAGGHVALRRSYDSSYFTSTVVVGLMAYLTVKFPDKMWNAYKATLRAVCMVAGLMVCAISSLFKCISRSIDYMKSKEASTAINLIPDVDSRPNINVKQAVVKRMITSINKETSSEQVAPTA